MQSFRVADRSSSYQVTIAAHPLQAEKFALLDQLLGAKQWQKADVETFAILSKICGLTSDRTIKIGNLSCYDFHVIDSLWLKHSQGRFGFSVQQRIWRQVCGETIEVQNTQDQRWLKFCGRVGWNDPKNMATAPVGYFPACMGTIKSSPTLYPKVFTRLYGRIEVCRLG